MFGSFIESRKLGDIKKRYWNRKIFSTEIPDLSVLLLIDGSGSMYGKRRDSAMKTSIILHEVLKKQKIKHSIVEHRGCFVKPEIDVNILVDFDFKEDEKYNIMQLDSDSDNRDGLALLWAEEYINKKTYCDNKLILVISDGEPCNAYNNYYPPISIKDTANIVKKIISRGTNVIAISLDDEDEYETYDALKEIYPYLVGCNNLTKLTGQVLKIISKQLG